MARTGRGQRIIAFANQKGGTAKTTTVSSLAYRMAEKGKKVLAVDLDPQGNLGQSFGLRPQEIDNTIAKVLTEEMALVDVVHEVGKNLYCVPANTDLVDTEVQLTSMKAREARLKRSLSSATGFDYILLDCPPNLGLMTVNALVAAQEVMVPLEPEFFSTSGFVLLKRTISDVQELLNNSLAITGVMITKFATGKRLHHDIKEMVEKEFEGLVFKTVIPVNIKLSEAQPAGESIFEFAPKSKGAQAYAELCKEIIKQEKGRAAA